MKTADYCRAAKRALGNVSDYALAKNLGLPKQTISKYVNGELVLNNTSAAKIAEIIGADPLKVIADCELERGSSPDLWRKLRDAAVVAAVSIGAASFGMTPDEALAFDNNGIALTSTPAPTSARDGSEIHIVRRLRRMAGAIAARLLAWLTGAML